MTVTNDRTDDGEGDGGETDGVAAVIENRRVGRFELSRRGEIVSFADYRERDGVVIVPHVETVRHHRGNGYAAELIEGLLAIVRSDGRRVLPLCPFAADHIRANPQHHDLVATR